MVRNELMLRYKNVFSVEVSEVVFCILLNYAGWSTEAVGYSFLWHHSIRRRFNNLFTVSN